MSLLREGSGGQGPDVPLFRSTEEAERYGLSLRRVLAPDEFQTLVRTWLAAQHAYGSAINLQVAANLACRVQTLREAVQAFLFPDGMAPHSTALRAGSAEFIEGAPVAPELESVGGS